MNLKYIRLKMLLCLMNGQNGAHCISKKSTTHPLIRAHKNCKIQPQHRTSTYIYIYMYTVYTVYRDLRFLSFISQVNGEETGETLSAYCSSPETVFGAAYLAILPSHRLLRGSSSVRLVLEKAFQAGRGECFLFHTDRSVRQHVCDFPEKTEKTKHKCVQI